MIPFVQQLQAFGMTVVTGMAAGFIFDLYRFARRGLNPRGGVSWFLDIVFWLIITPIVFALLLLGNWGELRLYVAIGLTAGGVLYFGWASHLVLRSMGGFLWAMEQVFMLVARVLIAIITIPLVLLRFIGGLWGSAAGGGLGRRRPGWRTRLGPRYTFPFSPSWRPYNRHV